MASWYIDYFVGVVKRVLEGGDCYSEHCKYGAYYSRAATIRGRYLIEEIWYFYMCHLGCVCVYVLNSHCEYIGLETAIIKCVCGGGGGGQHHPRPPTSKGS
jgi:hypothetical protein